MATAVAEQPVPDRDTARADRFLLPGISWHTYVLLRRDTDQSGRRLLLNYDNGNLEIEVPNELHEIVRLFASALLEAYLDGNDIDFSPMGMNTWRRELQAKGLEADACYYITNSDVVGTREELDLNQVPPPDLAIEIEISSPLLPKLPIYAGIGIPEVWLVKGWGEVSILRLDGKTATYRPVDRSETVPFFTAERLRDSIGLRRTLPFRKALHAFRDSMK